MNQLLTQLHAVPDVRVDRVLLDGEKNNCDVYVRVCVCVCVYGQKNTQKLRCHDFELKIDLSMNVLCTTTNRIRVVKLHVGFLNSPQVGQSSRRCWGK